jgi:uncharacterized protein YceH (UPF0502 family)
MQREIVLDAHEARVFGVLVEKALTTPEQYPLSINAATNGANQKSNRDPVLSLGEDEVAAALDRLEQKYLARKVFPGGSRVEKYVHLGKDGLGLDAAQLAVMAELLMRGPQTSGELRGRASRMIAIDSLEALAALLEPLVAEGFARRLDPAPGTRAERWVQLLSPDLHPLDAAPATTAVAPPPSPLAARVEALEVEVARLKEEVERLVAKS